MVKISEKIMRGAIKVIRNSGGGVFGSGYFTVMKVYGPKLLCHGEWGVRF